MYIIIIIIIIISFRYKSQNISVICVQISDGLCAALYDEEKCSRSADFLELRPGDQGVLPLLTTGLRRNDVESLIVSYSQASALSLVRSLKTLRSDWSNQTQWAVQDQ